MSDRTNLSRRSGSMTGLPMTGTTSVMEGSLAVAQAVKACRPGVISAYPITPQTHIVEGLARMVADGELDAEYVPVDSEFSAASVIAGASAAGVRAYTASASQGILLMTEVVYYLAGARLPVVITAANRQVSAPIGLQPDHQDSASLRDSGIIQLYVESAQEAYDTHIQAFKIAEDHSVLLPVMVCLDGYVLTHVFEPVKTFEQKAIDAFLPSYKPLHYLTPSHPMTFGTIADETNSPEFHYLVQQAMQNARGKIEEVAEEFKTTFGLDHGGLLEACHTEDAEVVFVAMGSTVSTLRQAVERLRREGIKVGLVKVRCYRPFPGERLLQVVRNARALIVLDRALSKGHQGLLASDVKVALYDAPVRPLVLGMLAGYGGREVSFDTARYMLERARRAIDVGRVESDVEFVGLMPELISPPLGTSDGIQP